MTRPSRARRPRRLPEGLYVDAFGDRILLSRKPGTREIPTAGRELCEIGSADFGGICPLCTRAFASVPDGPVGSAEHVPPRAVGGIARTRTCLECNGRASASEAELVRWWARAYPARFAVPDLPEYRNAGDVLFRTTANGNFAMVVSSSPRSGLDCVLERAKVTGHFTATFAMRSGMWKVALLKSAYLAACLHLGDARCRPRSRDHPHWVVRTRRRQCRSS
jgi:hypothetical protein